MTAFNDQILQQLLMQIAADTSQQTHALERIADALDKLERHLAPAVAAEAKPDAEGWIEWHGGECPVDHDTMVDYRFRSRGAYSDMVEFTHGKSAGILWWNHDNNSYDDIVAYRIHKEPAE